MDNRLLQYAIKDGELIHISKVESGFACDCFCPQCGNKLVAKKGTKKVFHFAHYNSEECIGSIETSLHMLAKNIIAEEMNIKLPAVYINFPNSNKESELIQDESLIEIDRVYLEKKIDDIIPDVIIEKGVHKLLIEVYVTHDVDENKMRKIEKIGISTLLIDLSDKAINITKEELKNIIVNETDNKKWLYNIKEKQIYNRFEQKARPFEASQKSGVFCPQYKHGWKGVSSARWEDCIECEYCLSINGEKNCLGYTGVLKIEDLNNPELEKKAKKLKSENIIKPEWMEGSQCKKCKQGYMKLNDGKYGKFLGCSNYPKCKHTLKL